MEALDKIIPEIETRVGQLRRDIEEAKLLLEEYRAELRPLVALLKASSAVQKTGLPQTPNALKGLYADFYRQFCAVEGNIERKVFKEWYRKQRPRASKLSVESGISRLTNKLQTMRLLSKVGHGVFVITKRG